MSENKIEFFSTFLKFRNLQLNYFWPVLQFLSLLLCCNFDNCYLTPDTPAHQDKD